MATYTKGIRKIFEADFAKDLTDMVEQADHVQAESFLWNDIVYVKVENKHVDAITFADNQAINLLEGSDWGFLRSPEPTVQPFNQQ